MGVDLCGAGEGGYFMSQNINDLWQLHNGPQEAELPLDAEFRALPPGHPLDGDTIFNPPLNQQKSVETPRQPVIMQRPPSIHDRFDVAQKLKSGWTATIENGQVVLHKPFPWAEVGLATCAFLAFHLILVLVVMQWGWKKR